MKPAAPAQMMSLSVKLSHQVPQAKLCKRKQHLNGWYRRGAVVLLQTPYNLVKRIEIEA